VAAKPGRQLDLEALRTWCGEQLARYKVPRDFQVVPQLPKGATGKIDRLSLKRNAADTKSAIT
jgi:acyl-coenzyme A synthetase/AMP-(fatty) acid ligase